MEKLNCSLFCLMIYLSPLLLCFAYSSGGEDIPKRMKIKAKKFNKINTEKEQSLSLSKSSITRFSGGTIDSFEELNVWNKITSQGSLLDTLSVTGKKGNAVSMKFDFTNALGYVVISKNMPLVISENCVFTFFIKGDAPENTFEFKLIDKDENVFWKKWVDYVFPKEWTKIVVKKRDIQFAWGPNPKATLNSISNIEFTVSCGKGGKGEVAIDELTQMEIEDTTKKFNIIATASSSEKNENTPEKTVDGRKDTRWSSEFADNQWLNLDLGKEEEIVGLVLNWEAAFGKEYEILLSKDGSNWNNVYATKDSNGEIDDINFVKQKTRYVKINCLKRGTVWGFSLYEVRIKGSDEEILLSASSSNSTNKIENILDGDKKTIWQSNTGYEQWVKLDLQRTREYGGLFIYWDNNYATSYDILASDDDNTWKKLYSVGEGNGGRDRIYIKDGESRYIKIDLKTGINKGGYGMAEIELTGPKAISSSQQRHYEVAAEESPKGYYPKYFLNKQTYWTAIGVSGDDKEALINEEGAFEVDKERFSIEPFLFLNDKLITWNDVELSQNLEKKYIPIPFVVWKFKDISMTERIFADGEHGSSTIFAWYRIRNNSIKKVSGKLFLTIRPFQVNPPWQCLNMVGGLAKIQSIVYDGNIINVDNEKKIFPLIKPDNFGATILDNGDITSYIKKGIVPVDKNVKDNSFCASAAMEYVFNLAPKEYKDVFISVPFHSTDMNITPNMTISDATHLVMKKFNENINFWDSRINNFEINLPDYDMKIVDTIRSNLAYILINKDGPGIQPGSRSYNRSWIRDGALTSSALLKMGLIKEVREFADWYSKYIFSDGKVPCAVDYRGAEQCPENDSNGEFIYLCKHYYNYTKDKSFLETQSGNIIKSADYIIYLRNQRKTSEYQNGPDEKKILYGLVPESISHEGYCAKPMHSYWDDFFALKGLKDASKIMEILDKHNLKEKYKNEAEDFRVCIYNSMNLTMKLHNIDYIPGCAELGDFDATSTSIGVYPCDEFDYMPRKELINTFDRYYGDIEKRFIPGNNWGEAFTPYELRNVRTFVYLEQKEKAHMMLDYFFIVQRPKNWNHWAEVIWRIEETPKFIGDMPHTWVGSDYINSARGLFVLENENTDSLLLCKGIKEKWLDRKEGISVKNLPTIWGLLNFELTKSSETVTMNISGEVNVPGEIILSSPISKPIKEVKINGSVWNDFSEKEIRFKKVPSEIKIFYRKEI